MGRKPNRTCEPVMVNNEDLEIVDGIIGSREGEEVFLYENRKRLVALRKEVIHEIFEVYAGVPAGYGGGEPSSR